MLCFHFEIENTDMTLFIAILFPFHVIFLHIYWKIHVENNFYPVQNFVILLEVGTNVLKMLHFPFATANNSSH